MLLTNWLKPLLSRRFWFLRASTSNRRRQILQTRYHFVSSVERLEDRLLLSFHDWDIDEVFSSLDGTIQFIELKNASDFQTQLASQSFTTNANTFTFPSSLPGVFSANTTFLMATFGFSALPGAVTPDFVIPDNFFSVTGDTLDYASGTDVFTFTSGQLPLDGVNSWFADLTTGTNSPKNFAGTSGSIDVPPTVALSLSGSPLAEADGVATVTATLSAASDQDVTVDLGFSGTATNVDDYTASGTQIVITAGSTTGSITLTAVQDALGELNETIIVDITSVTNGSEAGTQQVLATITDDDDLFTDFGDAPLPYPTMLAEDGAWHAAIGLTLGLTRDIESDGTHSAAADADGTDEDGVTFGTMRVGALGATLTVNVQGEAGKLDAWIDFNGDGAWGGPGEQIFASQDVVVGDNNLTLDVPSYAIAGTTYARFRLSRLGGLGVTGLAADGEVEDYEVTINNPAATDGVFGDQNTINTAADGALRVFAADVDSDGDMDILGASFAGDTFAWYENDGNQNFTEHTIGTASDGASSVIAADVDGDGDMDILSSSVFDDKIAWHENDGSQNFTEHIISTAADYPTRVFAVDMDGDGDIDVISSSSFDDKISWYENDGNQNFTDHTISTVADLGYSVFAADVDGDGDMDVLSASRLDRKVAWYENDGSQNFTEHIISTSANSTRSVYAADVDGDGDIDVLSASAYDDKIAWYENDGSQNFTEHVISTTADSAHSVFAADVDGDGDLDVLSASRFDDKIAWYENDGSQNFTPHTISTAADLANNVFAADVDGDGDLDVLSASLNDDTIAWYENLGNEGGVTPTLSIDDVSLAEGDSGETDLTFTISIDVVSASDVMVDFTTADDSAAAASDYTAISGTATITAGATSTTVTIKVQGDTTVEPDETFFVNLSNPVNATIDDNQGLGTIIDDDTDLATPSIDDVSQHEDGIFTFTITSDTAASSDITVVVNTADLVGQATAGSDYTAIVNQTATITAGSTSTTVTVTVTDDAIVEDNQTFAVNLSDAKIGGVTDPAQVVIGDGAGIGTIENNDTAVLTISNVTETETDSEFTVQATVTLSAEVEGGFDVAYSSTLGTAEATDLTVQGSSLSFLGTAGETQTIDVVIIGDDLVEDDETFTITLGDVTGTSAVQDAAITTGAVSNGLIIDDDSVVSTIDLDVDANGEAGALTDGVLIVRYLFGVTGTQLTDGALGAGATRTDPDEIIAFLEPGLTTMLDVDLNGEAGALTDGVLIVRYLFGVTGTQLTDGALGTGAGRIDPVEIIAFLDGFLPSAASASIVVSPQEILIADEPAVTVGIPVNFETGPNFDQGTFNDASTTNVFTTTGDVVLPTTISAPLLYPVLTEEEPDDETLTEEAPIIIPEEQAELDSLFGDMDGSLQDELLAV